MLRTRRGFWRMGYNTSTIHRSAPPPAPSPIPTAAATAYALFMKATLVSTTPIKALKVDLPTGKKSEVMVEGGQKMDWGEMTRVFAYDGEHNMFYLLQADFTATPHSKEDPAYPVIMFAANPVTGSMKQTTIQGAVNWVTGYYYNTQLNQIILATYKYTHGNKTGYNFYTVNPSSGEATLKSTTNFPPGEDSKKQIQDNWMGWFHSGSKDGKKVYRLGYADVVDEERPGLGITDISQSTATTTWISKIPFPPKLGMYITLSHLDDENFISLAPAGNGHLSVVKWGIDGSNATVLINTNGVLPRYYGVVWQSIAPDGLTYVAMTVKLGFDPVGATDEWEAIVVDLKTGTATTHALSPFVSGGTSAISGVGIPAS